MRYIEKRATSPLFSYNYLEGLTEKDRNRLASRAAKYIIEMGIPSKLPFKYSGIIMIGMVLGDEKGILLGDQTFIDDIIADNWREEVSMAQSGVKDTQSALGSFIERSSEDILNELVRRNIYDRTAKNYYYDYRNIMTLEYMASL